MRSRAVRGSAWVLEGSRRRPVGEGKTTPAGPVRDPLVACAAAVGNRFRQGEDPLGCEGLRPWLYLQPHPMDAHDDGVDQHSALIEVEDRTACGRSLSDAHPGAEHELNEVGKVEPARPRVGT